MEKALSDVTVLDLGQVIAMPFCTMLLADMGARVIKVESHEQAKERLSLGIKRVRHGVEERVPVAQYRDRNKQAITLNLKLPAAPVNNVAEMVADPQVQAREMVVELAHPTYGPVKITGTPFTLSETPARVERLAPLPGEHNEAIFVGLSGHAPDALARWQEAGVV